MKGKKHKVKMAAAIRVCVLEGIYAKMTELGLPLSLAVELQYRGLRLDSSLWTARLSNGGYSVSLFWPSQHRRPRRRRQRRKPKPSHQPISSLNPVSSGETVGSSCVQKDTTISRLPTSFPLKAHLGIKTASSQADSELIAVELEDSDPEETNLTSSHSAMEDSRAFDSEGAAKQTCPSPTTDSESEYEEVNLKSCLDVHYEKRDGVHGVLVHDKKGEQKWTPVCGRRRKRVRLNKVQLQRFPTHCRPSPPSATETSSSDLDVPLTIPKDAKVKYSVIDGTPGLSIATNRTRNWTPRLLQELELELRI